MGFIVSVFVIFFSKKLKTYPLFFPNSAVDLHVLEKAVASAHPNREAIFKAFIDQYTKTMEDELHERRKGDIQKILDKLENVRQRGRKRSMVG